MFCIWWFLLCLLFLQNAVSMILCRLADFSSQLSSHWVRKEWIQEKHSVLFFFFCGVKCLMEVHVNPSVWFQTWEESSGECLLQIELLDAIRTFISSLGYNSPLCYGMVLPILQYGMDVHSPNALNLLEDTVLVSSYCSLFFCFCLLSNS